MAAGTAYAKRWAGGFVDKPTLTTPIDQAFLNAVEAALLQLIGLAPSADGQVAQWDQANTRFGPALLLNKNIDPTAAIAKSKLDFTGANGLVNADVAGAAAIARSKLDFGAGLVNADIAAAAAISASKISGLYAGPVTYRGSGNPLTTIVNSAALADILNQSLAALTATSVVRFRLKGDYLNNSAANRGLQIQLLLGGTTLIDITEGSVSVNQASRASFMVEGWIQMADATHAHAAVIPWVGSTNFATATTGLSLGAEANQGGHGVTNGQVVVPDVTAAARTLQVRAAHSAASASLDLRVFDFLVEVI